MPFINAVQRPIYTAGSWSEIQKIVQNGAGAIAFPVGTQIADTWTDKATNTTYNILWDVVHHSGVTKETGGTRNGMFLQWHYASPFGVQFDNFEAFYYAETEALAAGTYNITIPTTWSKATAGTYQFTLTQDLPIGGQLSGLETCADTAPTSWKVKAWASKTATTATETVAVTEGSEGTSLGSLIPAGNNGLNSIQRVGYGYNRWSMSGLRQFLNSNKAASAWWTSQNNYDRPPTELTAKQGFLTGFSDDFLSILTNIKVTTALNTVTDSGIGTTEDTYDKIFLPSLQQEFITPQLADAEGATWDYWKRASGRSTYAPWSTLAEYITYGVENHATPQSVRLRSANRGGAYYTWIVYSSGTITSNGAYYAFRFAPACAVC